MSVSSEYRFGRMVVLGSLMGVVGLIGGWILSRLIALFLNLLWFGRLSLHFVEPHDAAIAGRWWTLLIPVAGAAVIGLMLRFGSRAIAGHGIPEAMEAVLLRDSRIAPRVAWLKPISAAISIGSGGPYGAEGPIIMTGGAAGSLLGQWLQTSAAERKVLLAAGAAAGMVAIFGTPIAAVLLAVELLLFEFSTRSFIPVALAAAVSEGLRDRFLEAGPLFPEVQTVAFRAPHLLWYAAFGIAAGVLATAITWVLYRIEAVYEHIPGLPFAARPLVGAVCVGLIGVIFPRVLGVGYDNIAGLLAGHFDPGITGGIFIWKSAAWSLSLSSGTSGGVLAPMFTIGGAAGALLGFLTQPLSGIPSGMVALIFMAAIFGASARATLTAIMFAAEVTGHYEALLPLLITCTVADYVAVRLLPYTVMTGKLLGRGLTVPQDYHAPWPALQNVEIAMGKEKA